ERERERERERECVCVYVCECVCVWDVGGSVCVFACVCVCVVTLQHSCSHKPFLQTPHFTMHCAIKLCQVRGWPSCSRMGVCVCVCGVSVCVWVCVCVFDVVV